MTKPLARRDQVEAQVVSDEWVVYDRHTDRLHTLRPFVARVWALCDGTTDVTEMALFMRRHPDEEPPTDDVWSALGALGEAGLLEPAPALPAGGGRSHAETPSEAPSQARVASASPARFRRSDRPSRPPRPRRPDRARATHGPDPKRSPSPHRRRSR